MAEQVQKSALSALDEQERSFVSLLTEFPRKLTIQEAGVEVGYNPRYAYDKARSAKIRAAIDEVIAEREQDYKRAADRVIRALAERAEASQDQVGNEAAKIFLQAVGRVGAGGVSVNVNATASTGGDSLEEAIKSMRDKRFAGRTASKN